MSEPNAVAPVSTGREKLEAALSPEAKAVIDANRARNAVVRAIRGTMWGKDLNQEAMRAVAEYCRQNQLDGVRHVEILGGRLYLTAEFYDERGAHLIRDGVIEPQEVDFINVDERLDKLAAGGDEWAKNETQRRLRERIKHAAPEEAKAIAVHRFRIASSGAVVEGVNWCGGGTRKKMGRGGVVYDADPIGDLEPTKTAETRARRRAWRKIADVVPAYGAVVRSVEQGAATALPVAVVEREDVNLTGPQANLGSAEDPYMLNAGEAPAAQVKSPETDAELLRQDRELAESETATRTREPGEG
jgi:hypothetical protein